MYNEENLRSFARRNTKNEADVAKKVEVTKHQLKGILITPS
jgi:hypothetical protein